MSDGKYIIGVDLGNGDDTVASFCEVVDDGNGGRKLVLHGSLTGRAAMAYLEERDDARRRLAEATKALEAIAAKVEDGHCLACGSPADDCIRFGNRFPGCIARRALASTPPTPLVEPPARAALAMPRGEDREAESPLEVELMSVACPRCNAAIGEACREKPRHVCIDRVLLVFPARTAERSEGVKDSAAGSPRACETCAAYCDLAGSEIPGFGTNRDRHHCAKLHRATPRSRCPECGKLPGCTGGR